MDINKIGGSSINNNLYSTKQIGQESEFEKAFKCLWKQRWRSIKRGLQGIWRAASNMVYKQMRATVVKSNLIPKPMGREIFESMLDDELVKEASKDRSYGLAEELYKQLSRNLGGRKV